MTSLENPHISIFEAWLDDLSTIQKIAYETWPDTFGSILTKNQIQYMLEMMYSLDSLKKQITEQKHRFLIVKLDDQPVGFISFELNFKQLPDTKIHKIYLLPKTQGRGIGTALIESVQDIAKKNANSALVLNVNKFNGAAKFYHKIGFETIATESIDIGSGYLMEDKVLKKEVDSPIDNQG